MRSGRPRSWLKWGACLLAVGSATLVMADPGITVVVMDPLCDRLACACVKGYAQRNYEALGKFLNSKLAQPVKVVYGEDLARALDTPSIGNVALIIGKSSVVKFDAAECRMKVRPIARLTGKDGSTTVTGLFVVRKSDPAKRLADLKGRTIFFGSPDADEKSRGAFEALRSVGIIVPKKVKTFEGCSDSALAVIESKQHPAPAGVISSYAAALIEGCGTVPKGSLRIVGKTAPFPFVTAFATGYANEALAKRIQKALMSLRESPELLRVMESKSGFVMPDQPKRQVTTDWPGWRGIHRDGSVPWLPNKLPPKSHMVWTQPLTNSGLAGVSVSGEYVVVADRDASELNDIFRCFRASDGRFVWKVVDPAPGHLDYGSSPRATPTLYGGLAYTLSAFGHLMCLELKTGKLVWDRRLVEDFGAKRPQWGYASSPLVFGDRIIINPGAPLASLVALDCRTGKMIWQALGDPAAYASFVLTKLGGKEQIVGYDSASLGGWNPQTGERLWRLVAPVEGDFNVPSPNFYRGRLVVSTENNGTRVYGFNSEGKIIASPLSSSLELAPDVVTPIVAGNRLVGCWGDLRCLDLTAGLKVNWSLAGPRFHEYMAFFSSANRVLVSTFRGELLLFDANASGGKLLSHCRLFSGEVGTYAQPAIVGSRIFVRECSRVSCFELATASRQ